jgi:hypothetical protein
MVALFCQRTGPRLAAAGATRPTPMERHSWRPATVVVEKSHVEKRKRDLRSCELSEKSRGIVKMMITEVGNGKADAVTKRRYQNALQHILDHGVFPGAIVAMKSPGGLIILDGSHRMGAFCGAQLMPDAFFEKLNKKRPALEQEVWIGTHADGEVPLT